MIMLRMMSQIQQKYEIVNMLLTEHHFLTEAKEISSCILYIEEYLVAKNQFPVKVGGRIKFCFTYRNGLCPIYGTYNVTYYPDKFADMEIEKLVVVCINKGHGCAWRDRLRYNQVNILLQVYSRNFMLFVLQELGLYPFISFICLKSKMNEFQ